MEELVILQYDSFVTLGERVEYDAQQTGCSYSVTDWALHGQLYLDELRRDHLSCSTSHCQEWGLFLLEHLLHNAANMQWKDRERTTKNAPKLSQVSQPKKWPLHTSLSGHFWGQLMESFWTWKNRCTGESMCWPQVNSPNSGRKSVCWS